MSLFDRIFDAFSSRPSAGYPVGTRCVCTFRPQRWEEHNYGPAIGYAPLVCGALVGVWRTGAYVGGEICLPGFPEIEGMIVQETSRAEGGRVYVWPVDWMRPIDKDIDDDDRAIIAAYEGKKWIEPALHPDKVSL